MLVKSCVRVSMSTAGITHTHTHKANSRLAALKCIQDWLPLSHPIFALRVVLEVIPAHKHTCTRTGSEIARALACVDISLVECNTLSPLVDVCLRGDTGTHDSNK